MSVGFLDNTFDLDSIEGGDIQKNEKHSIPLIKKIGWEL